MATIKALPFRRAPGPDGIPYEWYQTFADSLLPILLPLFNSVLSGGPAPPSWSRTLVSLIPKPGRDLSSIANWRPITLANCDVKIFSRMLASRLASVLPYLVSPHQAGFVKDRNAADVAMAVRDLLGHFADEAAASDSDSPTPPVDGALVFLDQEKAYDRISHPYLSAVLTKFGFSPLLQHAFAVTYTPTSAFFMDDGHPVGPVTVACGVRQGDPLAPLLFNLAFEPLLAALRKRLRGIRLPWGTFITGAYADDAHIGIALSDGRVLIITLNEYCRASNSRINFAKSKYMPLSTNVHSLPQWASDLGLQFHDPQTPVRVLGYDLVLSSEGVQEDWDALYDSLVSVSQDILSRRLTLQGRSLCVSSLLFSRLWYKLRVSAPSTTVLNKFARLGWKTVWNDHDGLAPDIKIGRCSRLTGGVSFLHPAVQAQALQAQWISTFLSRHTIWSDGFRHVLHQVEGGYSLLASTMRLTSIRKFPLRWQDILKAWAKLRPHWTSDLSAWSPAQALTYIPSGTHSARNLIGVPLVSLLVDDDSGAHPMLISDAAASVRFRREAPVRICKVLDRIRRNPSSLEAQLVHFLCSLPLPLPYPAPFSDLYANLLVGDTPVPELSTVKARRYLDHLDHISSVLDWNARAISRLAIPPSDIWRRVWRSPLLPRHRETWYKLLLNALPLGTRVFPFAPESLLCHACPTVQYRDFYSG